MKKKLYLAGGWFNPQQEEEHTRIYNLLKDKFNVFNPRLESNQSNVKMNAADILLTNLNGINDADVVVVITDYKDMGTIWESGYAYAMNKPIVYYAETLGNKPFNLMLATTGHTSKNETELLNLLNSEDTYIPQVYYHYEGEIL